MGGKTRELLTILGQHHTKTDVDLLYAPRKQGARGLVQLEGAYFVEITKALEYVARKEDPLLQFVRTHQHNISSAVLQTDSSVQHYREKEDKYRTAKQRKPKKDGERRECMNKWHVN